MRIRTLALVATPAALVLGVGLSNGPAMAAAGGTGHTVSQTVTQHGTWTEEGDTDFCTGAVVDVTFTGNSVSHYTYFPGGDEAWGTFTETGTATAEINGLQWSGRTTIWGNFNVNEKNANNTFTASFTLSATDPATGTVYSEVGHEVAHVSWNAVSQEPVVTFDKATFTCNVPG